MLIFELIRMLLKSKVIILILLLMGSIFIIFAPNSLVNNLSEKSCSVRKIKINGATTDLSKDQKASINITREIRISDFLYVTLNDTIKVKNLDNKPFASTIVFYPKNVFRKLNNLRITDYKGRMLRYEISIDTENFLGIRIFFEEALVKDAEYKFSIRGSIEDVIEITYDDSGNLIYNFTISGLNVYINHNITEVTTYLYYPEDADVASYVNDIRPQEGMTHQSEKRRIEWSRSNVIAFNLSDKQLEKIVVPFRRTKPIVKILSVEREIRIRISGKISTRDKFEIVILSPEKEESATKASLKLNSFKYAIYEGIANVEARDDFGKLDVFTEHGSGDKENWTYVTINFRTELFGNKKYSFEVTYDIVLNNTRVLMENESGIFFNFPIAPVINATFSAFRLSIVTPYVIAILNPTALEGFEQITLYKVSYLGLYVYEVRNYGKENMAPEFNKVLNLRIYQSPAPFIWLFIAFFGMFFLIIYIISIGVTLLGERAKKVKIEEVYEVREVKEELERYIKRLEEYIVAEESIYEFMFSKLIQKPTIGLFEQFKQMLTRLRVLENRIKTIPPIISEKTEIRIIIDRILDAQTNIELARRRILRNIQRALRGSMSKKKMIEENEYYLRVVRDKLGVIRRQTNRLKDLMITKYQIS